MQCARCAHCFAEWLTAGKLVAAGFHSGLMHGEHAEFFKDVKPLKVAAEEIVNDDLMQAHMRQLAKKHLHPNEEYKAIRRVTSVLLHQCLDMKALDTCPRMCSDSLSPGEESILDHLMHIEMDIGDLKALITSHDRHDDHDADMDICEDGCSNQDTVLYVSSDEDHAEQKDMNVFEFMQTAVNAAERLDDLDMQPVRRRVRGKRAPRSTMEFHLCKWPPTTLEYFASQRGIPVVACKRMLQAGLPILIFNLLLWMEVHMSPSSDRKYQCMEAYSGLGQVAKAFREGGMRSWEYDIDTDGLNEDACCAEGMLTMMQKLLMLEPGAIAHWATVCSSWVWMSSGTTDRHRYLRPEGNPALPSVRDGNMQAARMSLFMVLMSCLGVWQILEQPSTSMMPNSKWLRWVKSLLNLKRCFTWMGCFNAKTAKPTSLYHTGEWPSALSRTLGQEQRKQFEATDSVDFLQPKTCGPNVGKVRVCGNDGLKETQAYTAEYGRAVRDLHQASKGKENPHWFSAQATVADGELINWDEWQHSNHVQQKDFEISWVWEADLGPVAKLTNLPLHRPLL